MYFHIDAEIEPLCNESVVGFAGDEEYLCRWHYKVLLICLFVKVTFFVAVTGVRVEDLWGLTVFVLDLRV